MYYYYHYYYKLTDVGVQSIRDCRTIRCDNLKEKCRIHVQNSVVQGVGELMQNLG